MSVYAVCTATYIKIPADSGMLSRAQYLREWLGTRVLIALCWVGARDMLADGAAQVVVDR